MIEAGEVRGAGEVVVGARGMSGGCHLCFRAQSQCSTERGGGGPRGSGGWVQSPPPPTGPTLSGTECIEAPKVYCDAHNLLDQRLKVPKAGAFSQLEPDVPLASGRKSGSQ